MLFPKLGARMRPLSSSTAITKNPDHPAKAKTSTFPDLSTTWSRFLIKIHLHRGDRLAPADSGCLNTSIQLLNRTLASVITPLHHGSELTWPRSILHHSARRASLMNHRRRAAQRRRRISRYPAGTTNIDSNGAVIIPPTIVAAMRRITSEPVPLPHM